MWRLSPHHQLGGNQPDFLVGSVFLRRTLSFCSVAVMAPQTRGVRCVEGRRGTVCLGPPAHLLWTVLMSSSTQEHEITLPSNVVFWRFFWENFKGWVNPQRIPDFCISFQKTSRFFSWRQGSHWKESKRPLCASQLGAEARGAAARL